MESIESGTVWYGMCGYTYVCIYVCIWNVQLDGETGCSNVKGQLSARCLISLSCSCTDVLYATLSFAPAGVHSGAAGWTEQLNTLNGRDHMQESSVYLCTCIIYKLTILHEPYTTIYTILSVDRAVYTYMYNRALFCMHVCTVYYVTNLFTCASIMYHTIYTVYCHWTS